MEKIRLDIYLTNKNLAKSRNFAKSLILSENVLVNQKVCNKPNSLISNFDKVEVKKIKKYVSRGAYKLKAAIDHFDLNLKNLVTIDIGSSTGGFTQVLLENNVKKIYALDSGSCQLDEKLKTNKRVISLEKVNFKNINKNFIQEKIDFITIDVSFISIFLIIKKIIELDWNDWKAIVLLKPQFEIGKKIAKTKGFAKKTEHKKIIDKFCGFLKDNQIKNHGYIISPIRGAKKANIEYLFYLEQKNGK